MRTTFNDKSESILTGYDLNLGRETSATLWVQWSKQYNAEFSVERWFTQPDHEIGVRMYPSDRGLFFKVSVCDSKHNFMFERWYRPTASIPTEI